MKILFLDIDGVLNNEHTKERCPPPYGTHDGLKADLLNLFLEWHRKHSEVKIVLHSTWRVFDLLVKHLRDSGINIDNLVSVKRIRRADGIKGHLEKLEDQDVTHYAILDDEDVPGFPGHLVRTSYVHGLRHKDLKKLNKILELSE